jgi:hypothetical protein
VQLCWLQGRVRRARSEKQRLTARQPCDVTLAIAIPREETRVNGEYQLGVYARVAIVSLTLSASFGLAGCAAIDDLKVSILQWFDTENFTGEGEEPLAYAPEPRLRPPAEIPRRAAKAPRKTIKSKPQRVVLPISDVVQTVPPDETDGLFASPHSLRSPTPYPKAPVSFEERFCAVCWGLPAKN